MTNWAVELSYIATKFDASRSTIGEPNQDDINTLVNVIAVIRNTVPPQGTEAEIVARFHEAQAAVKLAASDLGAFFWTLVKAATTEAEARDLLDRIPSSVEKSFMIDYFINVSKILPPQ